MQKIIRFIATLSILGGLLAIRPLLALAIEPGPYPVAVGTSCWNLNEDIKFDNINSNWGFKISDNFNRANFILTAANGLRDSGQVCRPVQADRDKRHIRHAHKLCCHQLL